MFLAFEIIGAPPSPMISLTPAQAKTPEIQSCVGSGSERSVTLLYTTLP